MATALVVAVSALAATFGSAARAPQNNTQGLSIAASWTKVSGRGAAPLGRIPAGFTSCDGKLFVFGGETDYGEPDDPFTVNRYMNDVWMFTPRGSQADGTWTELSADGNPDGPGIRVLSSMVCYGGKLFIFGGHVRIVDQTYETAADFWSLDIASRRWQKLRDNTAIAGGPEPIAGHTGTLVKDNMVIFGGRSPFGLSDRVWIYSLTTGRWTAGSPPFGPSPRHFHIAVAIPGTSTMRVWGGVMDGTLWEYDVSSDRWGIATGRTQEYQSGRAGAFAYGRLWSYGGFQLIGSIPNYGDTLYAFRDGLFQTASMSNNAIPDGRCYASMFEAGGALWMYGGYRRPADEERLSDLWRVSV